MPILLILNSLPHLFITINKIRLDFRLQQVFLHKTEKTSPENNWTYAVSGTDCADESFKERNNGEDKMDWVGNGEMHDIMTEMAMRMNSGVSEE